MAYSIILGICVGSFLGLVYMIASKIPQLLSFPVAEEKFSQRMSQAMKGRVLEFPGMKWLFSPEFFLLKILSFLRILFLRMEHKTGVWLMTLRKKSQEKNGKFSENYWEHLKKK